ncbi:wiskott-Aldrich syndrome protein family member 2-like [Helianthus annuus]|uniref:wiskott-Aldrich syndrome protein family member 2-like n=1 Tax=Helianthus annuus TaxID=4232 RepID=UPI000B8FA03A|nr:wiskott-Aldrich syndrome protein family member 2-like [Helianthus annuus]
MGGPSNPVSEVDSPPVAPPLPHMGYDNPIPSYAGPAAYNPFEQPAYSGYNYYNTPNVDPYNEAANYNALHPEGPFQAAYPTGYPAYGYQCPPPPQPPQQQPPQPPQIQPPQQQEILQRLHEVEQQQSSYVAESDEVNSHPRERNDTTKINVAGADLQAMIDNAVTRAIDRQFKESSGTRSRTLSAPHTKPPSKSHASHKDDSHQSSNQMSVPSKKVVLNQEPRVRPVLINILSPASPGTSQGKKEPLIV